MAYETFQVMLGKTMKSVTEDGDTRVFTGEDGARYTFYHAQDCCESVTIEEVVGDLSDLVGAPILQAEEVSESDEHSDDMRVTWTFYKFATIKGSVTVRWYGSSNGYYSESVDFRVN